MGNGTKVALVALLIVMVVVVAKFVTGSASGDEQNRDGQGGTGDPAAAGANSAENTAKLAKKDASSRTRRDTRYAGKLPSRARSLRSSDSPNSRPTILRPPTGRNLSPPIGSRRTGSPGRTGESPLLLVTKPEPADDSGNTFVPIETPGKSSAASSRRTSGTSGLPVRTGAPGSRAGQTEPVPPPETARRKMERVVDPRRGEDPRKSTVRSENFSSSNVPPPRAQDYSSSRGSSGGRSPADRLTAERTAPKERAKPELPAIHTIQRGESPWALADRYYGHGKLYPLIQKANRGIRFVPGKKVKIPALSGEQLAELRASLEKAKSAATRDKPSPTGQRLVSANPAPIRAGIYTVRPKDTLSDIAKRYYGDASKYTLIEDANERLKWTVLRAGEKIRIPRK